MTHPPASTPSPTPVAPAPTPRKHFAYQLAQLSLAAPVVAIILGVASNGAFKSSGSVSNPGGTAAGIMLLAGLNLLLLVVSVIAGVIALCYVPRLGRKGILGRSITGVALSMLFLVGAAYLILSPSIAARAQKRLAGEWYSTVSAAGVGTARVQMNLNADGTARWEMVDGPRPMAFRGRWRVRSPAKYSPDLTLELVFDAPDPALPEVKGLGWRIKRIQETELDLLTNDADGNPTREVYTRKP